MTNVNTTADAEMNALLSKMGIATSQNGQETSRRATSDKLGQQDFLKLLTTQLANQDPFKPMENGEFIAQMAQFSMVSGLDEVKNAVQSLGSTLGGNRVATFANLLGSRVLVPGGEAVVGEDGLIEGAVDLSESATSVRMSVRSAAGEVLDTVEIGPAGAGLLGFAWSASERGVRMEPGQRVRIEISTSDGTGSEAAAPGIYDVITGVDVRGTNETLSLRSGRSMGVEAISSIRK